MKFTILLLLLPSLLFAQYQVTGKIDEQPTTLMLNYHPNSKQQSVLNGTAIYTSFSIRKDNKVYMNEFETIHDIAETPCPQKYLGTFLKPTSEKLLCHKLINQWFHCEFHGHVLLDSLSFPYKILSHNYQVSRFNEPIVVCRLHRYFEESGKNAESWFANFDVGGHLLPITQNLEMIIDGLEDGVLKGSISGKLYKMSESLGSSIPTEAFVTVDLHFTAKLIEYQP